MERFKGFIFLVFFAFLTWNCTDDDSIEQQLAEQELAEFASGEEGEDDTDDEKD